MIDHQNLVNLAARWLKRNCGCSVVLTELKALAATGERPDAIGWRSNYSVLVECKTSRSDFLADSKKPFRKDPALGVGAYRFYLCPPGVIRAEDLPCAWGLLYAVDGQVNQAMGPKGNAWTHGDNQRFSQQRNADAEIAMLVSAHRRMPARGS